MPKTLKCCIRGCNENSRNVMEEISFHRIPKDETVRKRWIDLIRSKTNQPNVFPVNALVCSKHFAPNQLVERVNGSRLLINFAVPSIFPNEHLEWSMPDVSDDDETSLPLISEKKAVMLDCSNSNNILVITKEEKRRAGSLDFQKSCRFCLTVPFETEIESTALSEHIASMYTSLTGIETSEGTVRDFQITATSVFENAFSSSIQFFPTTFAVPETICKECSSKLQDAFEFRELLIKMNNHWETVIKTEHDEETVMIQTNPETIHLETEMVILDHDSDEVKNEVNTEVDKDIIEFVDYERLDDDSDEVKQTAESDEDDRFIEDAANFIKTVKQVPRSELKKMVKPVGGVVLSAKKAKTFAADTERRNFRSSSCPHSSQKLKKYNKWWRLMHDCNYCEAKDFLNVEALHKHLRLHHADRIKVTCDICKKDFMQIKYLRKHMKYVHQRRQYECKICNKKFYYNYNLNIHMQIHNNEKTVICHLCGKFFTPAALYKHMRTNVHGHVPTDTLSGKEQKCTRYYCYICIPAKRFDQCSELTEHRRLLHNDFTCPVCNNWFSCAESLKNHLKTHSNKERKHCCTLCPSTYVRVSHLEGHMRRKHSSDPKPISCDLCDYKCVEPYELYGHKKHAHTKARPFECTLCGKAFSKDQALKDHMLKTHGIGEYRYSCSECPKRFTNSAGLVSHRGIYHRGDGNKIS